jgi:hypothetical protein
MLPLKKLSKYARKINQNYKQIDNAKMHVHPKFGEKQNSMQAEKKRQISM